ncbi:uncharacterized protein LOC105426614 isoform X3 [Pogonomyrmex barbatus]|uniref:Uncharacterized protein LOC105426614 isoform X3 n=1 Tax=Pogonomyrmex barbatus TaxID=144034 RepID=A0A6I9W359_9HYME|nr:uncharacterized protein LOC105426614 isoform X3 [Pogonomyrmex barbatus]
MSFCIRKKINAAEFISHLIDIGTKGGHCEGTLKFISLHIETTFSFLINKMRVISTKLMFQDYTKYINIVSSHLNSLSLISAEVTRNTHQSYIERLQRESINLVKDLQSNVNMQYLYGLHILYLSQEVRVDRLNDYTEDILYILSMSMNICQNITTKRNLRERIVSEYLLLLSKLIYQYLVNNLETLKTTVGTLLSYLQQFLEFGLLKIIPEVAKILGIVIDHFMCKDNNEYRSNKILIFIFEKCFTCITENNKDNMFWTAMQSIMGVIISNNFLRLPDAAEFTKTHIFTLLNNKVISLSKLKSIIFSRLVNLEVDNTLKLEALLTDCLFHFAMYQCNAKIDYAHLFIAKHLNKYYSQNIFT